MIRQKIRREIAKINKMLIVEAAKEEKNEMVIFELQVRIGQCERILKLIK